MTKSKTTSKVHLQDTNGPDPQMSVCGRSDRYSETLIRVVEDVSKVTCESCIRISVPNAAPKRKLAGFSRVAINKKLAEDGYKIHLLSHSGRYLYFTGSKGRSEKYGKLSDKTFDQWVALGKAFEDD